MESKIKNRKLYILILMIFSQFTFNFCSLKESRETEQDENTKLVFTVSDSLIVNHLGVLVIDDYDKDLELFAMRDFANHQIYLVNKFGDIVQVINPMEEGENFIGGYPAFGTRFFDGQLFVKGINGIFHIFDLNGKKLDKISLELPNFYTTISGGLVEDFDIITNNGDPYIFGFDYNLIDLKTESYPIQKLDFFSTAKYFFKLNIKTKSTNRLRTFPSSWEPVIENLLVQEPMVAYSIFGDNIAFTFHNSKEIFYSKVQSDFKKIDSVSKINHPLLDFNYGIEDFNIEDISNRREYPSISNLRLLKDFTFFQINTVIPFEILSEIRKKYSAFEYFNSIEYKEAVERYVKFNFVLKSKNGKEFQFEELPVEGQVDFVFGDNTLIINPNFAIEKDYSVFYFLKVEFESL